MCLFQQGITYLWVVPFVDRAQYQQHETYVIVGKETSKIPPLNINKIATFRQRRLDPSHMNLEKKETLKVVCLAKALYITNLELRRR